MTGKAMDCIAVIGAGVMGRGIAQVSAAAGYRVKVFDIALDRAQAGVDFAASMLRRAAEKGQMTAQTCQAAIDRLEACSELPQLRGADMAIEAVSEDLQVKHKLLVQLEAALGDDAILASNTSSLVVTQLASACSRPERVAGLHFFNPVPLMKLVEIIPGVLTAQSVVDRLRAYVERVGHQCVLAADTPGFLVNHAGRAFYTEGVRIVGEGIAGVVDTDRVAREALGFRMGPFELFDHTGLDVSYPVLTKIYQQFFEEPRFRPHPLLTRQFAAGLYGKKTDRGFYPYEAGTRVETPEVPFTGGSDRPVWVEGQGAEGSAVTEMLRYFGARVDDAAKAGSDSVIVLLPFGLDATTSASRQGLPLERCVALDTLVWPVGRLTIMPTARTRPEFIDSLHGMLVRGGQRVTRIHDSPGFIGQRILASIVNLACDIAQQRIGSPADIDRAVRLGLGYPKGPLAWGTEIGAARVLEVLENLFEFYGDPRYRPSPWLKRRAIADLPLHTPDT
jgi:3-hydroxybutyryl-CoA dehydrogenase